MKVLISGLRMKTLIIFVFLVSFFFSGIGIVQGFPIFFTAMAQAHPVFFSENNQRIRLILHHPGNHDAHEVISLHTDQNDLLDMLIGVSKKDGISHSDHELELSATEDPFSRSDKTELLPNLQELIVLKDSLTFFSLEQLTRFSGLSPPTNNKSPLSLRTTILII